MDKNTKVLEALQMQPLSEAEMTTRHILGRLYGPIATCIESTRNGRLYNKDLWEKALEDEIFLEKVATKALFLELGHPADREETDMKQACACIPEVPKIVGDDLYAYVDILDTPNGRLLKTLVDYGFVPGISSRGSGDVMDNNQVDPETFFLETWDIVQLPAVKKARLNVCESLSSGSSKLRKALAESYNAAKDEDKDTMKKALENLHINIDEALTEDPDAVLKTVDDLYKVTLEKDSTKDAQVFFTGTEEECQDFITNREKKFPNSPKLKVTKGAKVPVLTEDPDADLPWDTDEDTEGVKPKTLIEDGEDIADTEDTTTEENEEVVDTEETESSEVEPIEDVSEADEASIGDAKIIDITAEEESDIGTVGDLVELLGAYDAATKIEFASINIDGTEYPITNLTSSEVEGDTKTLLIGVDCAPTETTEGADEDIASEEIETEETEEIADEETPTETESAEDSGDDADVLESLKEAIRQKKDLEILVSDLRKAKSVGDTEVSNLKESLAQYKKAFTNVRKEAAKAGEFRTKISTLSEELSRAQNTIKTLTKKVNNTQQLKESVDSSKAQAAQLTEQLRVAKKQNQTLEAKLEGQTKLYNQKLEERTNLAKTYKARFIESLNKYVESKANMLGVQPSEITSRLNENYTLADVDAVCDQILDSAVGYGRLPFGGRTKTSARMVESVSRAKASSMNADSTLGYEIDDSLLELAGMK